LSFDFRFLAGAARCASGFVSGFLRSNEVSARPGAAFREEKFCTFAEKRVCRCRHKRLGKIATYLFFRQLARGIWKLNCRTNKHHSEEKFMAFFHRAWRRFAIAGELLFFLWSNKRWWLVPMVAVLFAVALLLLLGQSSGIAPFIYTLF
jgi:hypothetical protein